MIGFTRPEALPENLLSPKIQEYLVEHRAVYDAGDRVASSKFYKGVWQNDTLRDILWRAQNKKCCYCEKILELKRESDVEHFRPKAMVSGRDNHSGYWWLAYTWENYLYSCKHCNQEFKANHFELQDENNRATTEMAPLDAEAPLLINPFDDEPNDYLAYDRQGDLIYITGRPSDQNGRGEYTIVTCGLNREEILRRRIKVWKSLSLAIRQYLGARQNQNEDLKEEAEETIREIAAPDSPDSGMAKYFLDQYGLETLLK